MNDKKDKKAKGDKMDGASTAESTTMAAITSKADLKNFLLSVRDKMSDDTAAPIYVLSAMNYLLNIPDIYDLLDKANKEVARDIWLRLRQSGVQLKNPPLLFDPSNDQP